MFIYIVQEGSYSDTRITGMYNESNFDKLICHLKKVEGTEYLYAVKLHTIDLQVLVYDTENDEPDNFITCTFYAKKDKIVSFKINNQSRNYKYFNTNMSISEFHSKIEELKILN